MEKTRRRRGSLEAAKCSARRGGRPYASERVVGNCPTEGSRRRRSVSSRSLRLCRRPRRPDECHRVRCVGGGRPGHHNSRQWAGRQDEEGGPGGQGTEAGGGTPHRRGHRRRSRHCQAPSRRLHSANPGLVFQRTPQHPRSYDLVRSGQRRGTQQKRHPIDDSFSSIGGGSEGRGTSPGRPGLPRGAKLTPAPVLRRSPSTASPVTPRRPQTAPQRS